MEKFKDSSGKPPQNISQVHAITTESLPSNFGPPRGNEDLPTGPPPVRDTSTADRAVLRDLLLEGLEDSVAFGHKPRKFDISDEAVVAHFEGSLLIGADGSSSVVCRQYLPQHRLLDTGLRCLYGKTIFTEGLLQAFQAMGEQCTLLIVDELDPDGRQLAMFVQTMRFQDNDIRADLPDDYVYWVLVGDQRFFIDSDETLLSLTGADAAQLSKEIRKHWHESIRTLLELQDSTRTAALRGSTAAPEIAPWETCSRITFMGDAIHLMPPTGGIGVNTALEDVGGSN